MINNKLELLQTRNYKKLNDIYIRYPLNFAKLNNLNVTQALLFTIISHFSKLEHKAYTGSLQSLQVMLNISKYALHINLKSLTERGFISKIATNNGRTAYIPSIKNEKFIDNEIFIDYPLKFATKLNLSNYQTLLYSIILHFNKINNSDYTLSCFADYLCSSKNSVRNNIKKLIELDLVSKIEVSNNERYYFAKKIEDSQLEDANSNKKINLTANELFIIETYRSLNERDKKSVRDYFLSLISPENKLFNEFKYYI